MLAPHFLLADAAKDRVDLHRLDGLRGLVAQLQRDAWDELVLAVGLNARVVPAGDNVGGLENRGGIDAIARGGEDQQRKNEGRSHGAILDTSPPPKFLELANLYALFRLLAIE